MARNNPMNLITYLKSRDYFHLFIVIYSFLIPLGVAVQNIGVGVFVFLWLKELKSAKIQVKYQKIFLIFISYLLISIVSFIQAGNYSEASSSLYRLAPLILFPLVFFYREVPSIKIQTIVDSIIAFSVSLFIVVSVIFLEVLIENKFNLSLIRELPSKRFSTGLVNYHYLYLALYISYAIVLLLLLNLMNLLRTQRFRTITIAMAFLFFLYLFLLASRTSLAIVIVVVSLMFLIRWIRTKRLKSIFLFVLILLFSLGATYYIDLPLVGKMKEAINYKGEYSSLKKVWGGKMMREEIWHCSILLISKKPLLGYGPGSVQEKLDRCLETTSEKPVLYTGRFKFNAHNQYLQFAMNSGLFALFLFILFLGITVISAIKRGNKFYSLFIIISALSFLTESILERNHGITIFAFFSCLFYLYNSERDYIVGAAISPKTHSIQP